MITPLITYTVQTFVDTTVTLLDGDVDVEQLLVQFILFEYYAHYVLYLHYTIYTKYIMSTMYVIYTPLFTLFTLKLTLLFTIITLHYYVLFTLVGHD